MCVVISRCSREDSLIIVKLAWTGWSTAVVFPPHVEEVFHVNPCVTCVCDCVYISAAYCCWLNLSSKFIAGQRLLELCIFSPLPQQSGIRAEVKFVLKF